MGQFREQGKLPSSTVVNPNGGFETAIAITLRSGKELGTNLKSSKQSQIDDEKLLQEEDEEDKAIAREEQPCRNPLRIPRNPNGNWFSNRTEGFLKINSFLLMKAFGH
ncbi:hypothetical protein ACFX2C_024874 [Malus domestica]